MARKKVKKNNPARTTDKVSLFAKFKLTESYTSLILGAIVILIIGILILTFAKGNRTAQISSTFDEEIKIAKEVSVSSKTSSTYTVNLGDDLWSISENLYKDGYRWVEIAKANNLDNPGIIYAGNKLVIPTITSKEQSSIKISQEDSSAKINAVIENNSITGNTYVIRSGDNLWDIAVRAYGDGFKWPEIAKANNLENPSLIFPDNVLKIPR